MKIFVNNNIVNKLYFIINIIEFLFNNSFKSNNQSFDE